MGRCGHYAGLQLRGVTIQVKAKDDMPDLIAPFLSVCFAMVITDTAGLTGPGKSHSPVPEAFSPGHCHKSIWEDWYFSKLSAQQTPPHPPTPCLSCLSSFQSHNATSSTEAINHC